MKTKNEHQLNLRELTKKAGGRKNLVKVYLNYCHDNDLGMDFGHKCGRDELVKVLEMSSTDFGIGKTLIDIRVNYCLCKEDKKRNYACVWIDKNDLCMLIPHIRPNYDFHVV